MPGPARRVHEARKALAKKRRVSEPGEWIVVGEVVEQLGFLDVLERERDIAGKLEQQPHFVLGVEKPGRVRVQSEHPGGLVRHQQRQNGKGAKTALERLFAERDPRIHGHVLDDHRLAFFDGAPGKTVFFGGVLIEPEGYHSDIALARSLPSHGLHPIRF